MAEPAGLVASELVTNAAVHARTALELRVELRGSQMHVAVKDQDPNLGPVQAAKQGTDRGRGLAIVDRVAAAWGVRQEGLAAKVVWCILNLPPQHAATSDGDRQLQATTRTAAMAVGMNGADHRSSEAMGSPGPELVWTKLWPPATRAGLIPRASLQSLLQLGLQGKLCLVDAPAGFGKTTLLTQWRAVAGAGRVAWVSLDEGDNDPTRFWAYVVEALRTVEPGVGGARWRPWGAQARTCTGRSCRDCSTS